MITKEYDKLVQTRRLLGYRLEQAPAVQEWKIEKKYRHIIERACIV
jgi:hypothetical protein